MSLYKPGSSSAATLTGRTEFEILKASHKYVSFRVPLTESDATACRFLREDGKDESQLTWEEKLAHKYYSSLYREYAVCDLKHYKSGNVRAKRLPG